MNDDDIGTDLTDRDKAILRFESEHPKHTARKEELIRSRFGWTAARYVQVLTKLVATTAALEHDPMLVHRIRQAAADRAAARASRKLNGTGH